MSRLHRSLVAAFVVTSCVLLAAAQPPGRGQRGRMHQDDDHMADMEVFHFLVDNRADITRTVTQLPNGVDTLTESDRPEVAAKIRAHVDAMYARLDEGRPIRMRDPLFRAIFEYADTIDMARKPTAKGIRVIETSDNAYAVKLIKAHAEVISGFLANGRAEMMKDHPAPPK